MFEENYWNNYLKTPSTDFEKNFLYLKEATPPSGFEHVVESSPKSKKILAILEKEEESKQEESKISCFSLSFSSEISNFDSEVEDNPYFG